MKTKIHTREIMLLVILVVVLIFYYISQGPVQNILSNLESQRNELQGQISALAPYISQINTWQGELDRLEAESGGELESIPEYNNINNVIAEMSVIFDGDSSYSITFSNPTINDHIAKRDIRITFSCYEYSEVINKLNQINGSNNRYRITDMSLNEGANELYSVSLSLIAYEYYE